MAKGCGVIGEWPEAIGTIHSLGGGDARLKYTVNGEYASAYFYVLKDGETLSDNGGFPEATASKAGSDETRIVKPAGTYYLDVTASGSDWSVTIEELK